MKTGWRYVKEHIKGVCLYFTFAGIFALIFYLYRIRMDAVRYAFLLCFILLILYGVIDYLQYVRRHSTLLEIENQMRGQWKALPTAKNVIEQDYQRMLEELFVRAAEAESVAQIAHQDMMDYYGLWTHQIKTPIAAMRILLQSQNSIKDETLIKSLKVELFKIQQYVDMVLSYLRMEEMSSDLVLNWYPLDDIVRQAVRNYAQMFILRRIKLNLQEFTTNVLTDEKWIVFVIEQVLSNALKYTKTGSVDIYMEEEGEEKLLVIEDTGIGIQKEDIHRVFEKGFTGYNGRTEKKSTGIGLYLCRTVMSRLNHKIWLESDEEGTRVFLSLGRKERTQYE